MLYDSLACKFGGLKITQFCRLVKSRVGKTGVMSGKRCCGEAVKESCEDRFLLLFAEKLF